MSCRPAERAVPAIVLAVLGFAVLPACFILVGPAPRDRPPNAGGRSASGPATAAALAPHAAAPR